MAITNPNFGAKPRMVILRAYHLFPADYCALLASHEMKVIAKCHARCDIKAITFADESGRRRGAVARQHNERRDNEMTLAEWRRSM